MTKSLRPTRLALVCAVFALGACRSVTTRSSPAAPAEPERTLVQVDSEVFAGVVRGHLAGRDDEYPHRLERLHYDARPYGTAKGRPEVFAGVQGVDPSLSFPRASESESEIAFLTETRKRILRAERVPDSAVPSYEQCAGAGVPTPPPPRASSARRRPQARDVHAGCPRTRENYVIVGLPIRGQPPGLKDVRDTRGDRVRLEGDVWTVLVDEHSFGPGGWTVSHYAWLFRRNRDRQLELENTVLIGVVE